MSPRTRATLGIVSLAAVAAAVACDRPGTYLYGAQKFDATAGCLGAYQPIEVVQGNEVSSTCPALCLRVADDLYVSTVCPPLPTNAEAVEASDPDCAAALQAARDEALCDAPEDPDAGGEEEDSGGGGEEDAASDAPAGD